MSSSQEYVDRTVDRVRCGCWRSLSRNERVKRNDAGVSLITDRWNSLDTTSMMCRLSSCGYQLFVSVLLERLWDGRNGNAKLLHPRRKKGSKLPPMDPKRMTFNSALQCGLTIKSKYTCLYLCLDGISLFISRGHFVISGILKL